MRNIIYGLFMLLLLAAVPASADSFRQAEVRGTSMSPLIPPGTVVEIDYEYYENNPVERGHIVIVSHPGRDVPAIKTVRGIPADRFELKDNGAGVNILINDKILINSQGAAYTLSGKRKKMLSLYSSGYGGIIPPGAYLILGENPAGSFDSTRFGLISSSRIIGRLR